MGQPAQRADKKIVNLKAYWEGFLPEQAVVMARKAPTPSAASTAASQDPAIQTLTESETIAARQELPLSPLPDSIIAEDSLEKIAAELAGCQRCKLCVARHTIVVGEGNPKAELVFVGEGPGETEDLQGRPFVGKAGQLLDKMIEAMGLTREKVFITNVVKCRPPGNRNPEPDELATCSPFLLRQLDVIRPKIVVALGKSAAQALLQTDQKISDIRGKFFDFRGIKLIPTFHPAYLLRSPEYKREAWADLQLVARELGLKLPAQSSKKKGDAS